MPMYKARKLCPDAIVIRPDMAKYQQVGRAVRALMLETTPLVEPISIDEAFLDLSGTEKLHKGSAARTLAGLAKRIESDIGITVTVGLSHNKFLAKIASDLDKPRGFAVIGRRETLDFLDHQPVAKLWGVGRALQQRLQRDGFIRIGDLRRCSEDFLVKRYGSIGQRLYRFSRGEDSRRVDPQSNRKSMSAETTFSENLAALDDLKTRLWPLCEKVAARAKAADLAGGVVTIKLKTGDFRIRTRNRTLPNPTQLAETIWQYGCSVTALSGSAICGDVRRIFWSSAMARSASACIVFRVVRIRGGSTPRATAKACPPRRHFRKIWPPWTISKPVFGRFAKRWQPAPRRPTWRAAL